MVTLVKVQMAAVTALNTTPITHRMAWMITIALDAASNLMR